MMLTRWLKRISPVTSLGNPTENRHLEYRLKGNIAMCSNNRGRKDLESYPAVGFGSSSVVYVYVCVYVCLYVCIGLTTLSVTQIAPNGWTFANTELESLLWSDLRSSSGTCLETSRMLRIFLFLRRFKLNTSGTPTLLLETACKLIISVKLHSYFDTSCTTLRNGSSKRSLLWGCALD